MLSENADELCTRRWAPLPDILFKASFWFSQALGRSMRGCVFACLRVLVCACVRACVCLCVLVCERVSYLLGRNLCGGSWWRTVGPLAPRWPSQTAEACGAPAN